MERVGGVGRVRKGRKVKGVVEKREAREKEAKGREEEEKEEEEVEVVVVVVEEEEEYRKLNQSLSPNRLRNHRFRIEG